MTDKGCVDVVIIGGGPAGLAAALMLGRSRRSVVVVDAGQPRNAPAQHIHGYLGLEGTSPTDYLATARREVGSYGVEVLDGQALDARRADDGTFTVSLAGGRALRGRRLVVATGLVDELPEIPGVAERWGRDVLHCPYCHGWEVQDRPIAVIATSPMGAHQAALFRQLSDDVTLIVHSGPPPTPTEREQLSSRAVRICESSVAELVIEDDRLVGVRLADGEVIAAAAVVVAPRFVARTELLGSLGLEPVEVPLGIGAAIEADQTGATSVEGVYVAGNVTNVTSQVLQSAAAGATTGAVVNAGLVAEDTAAAVAAQASAPDSRPIMDASFWDERYRSKPAVWSGQPNPHLVTELSEVTPGVALDVGAGEGADAIWLAERGWTVKAVDISETALARGRRQAAERGAELAERITWMHDDVLTWEPPVGAFDLVNAQFMHFSPEDRGPLYARCADAVAPGGTLLIIGHHPSDVHSGVGRPPWPEVFFTAEEVADTLGPQWTVVAADTRPRPAARHDGTPTTVRDSVLVARRSG